MTRRDLLLKRRTVILKLGDDAVRRMDEAQKQIEKYEKEQLAIEEEIKALGTQPTPLSPKDLVYAATARCPCGAGLAYVDLLDMHGHWDCSAILLGIADATVQHTAKLPFMFYEIKSEKQPSANGATTRPNE